MPLLEYVLYEIRGVVTAQITMPSKIQMLVKFTKFYPYFGFCYLCTYPVKIGQSRDKILYILLVFLFYPVMMIAS